MSTGRFTFYGKAHFGFIEGTMPSLNESIFTGVLLKPTYTPDFASHSIFSDIAAYEEGDAGAFRVRVYGSLLERATRSFTSDDLVFGDPVTLGPVKYLAFVYGLPTGLSADSSLLGLIDLEAAGGAVEAQNSRFSISPGETGWFSFNTASYF